MRQSRQQPQPTAKRLTAISLAVTAALTTTAFASTKTRTAMPEAQRAADPMLGCDPAVTSGASF
ncbi:hypothetical protein [Paraburkholderia lacunae]|uniref:Uncharacterized protein n=1 Tax=Paraburkholderia lacunae TaxID=2211104 RepID=A0A370N550_9BURK|nr:hypothetical protein [Paraburkholderia lacunae]RDK00743.1 hypothetical protein DLM46_20520 [Paraburkholderia lacunae]